MLRNNGATAEHIDAIQSQVGAVRFRPEEVAGAAANDRIPASFGDAEKRAAEILDKLANDGLRAPTGS